MRPSTLPADPEVARWWREAAEREEAEARAAAREREWAIPALAARAGRYLRAVDAALEGGVRSRSSVAHVGDTGPAPDHSEAMLARELCYRGGGKVLRVW